MGVRRLMGAALYFITGSSGSGKTTLVRRLAQEYPALRPFHVDDPGVKGNARAWVERVDESTAGLVLVEGQERPHVVLATARDLRVPAVHLVLIDCGHAERRRRLLEERRQPELDGLDTYAWAAYLRGQADALGLEVIDTTGQSINHCVEALSASVGQSPGRTRSR